MKKFFTLLVLVIAAGQSIFAQVVNERFINFRELAAFEAQNPDAFKPCPTCEKKEGDRWSALYNPNMPIPMGGSITTPPVSNQQNVPMAPSRPPAQTFLGHLDVGTIIPPDSHGAVGLNHVVTATNNFIRIHNKAGGAMISQVTISAFTGVGNTCDPYLKFDPIAQRWIFSAIGCGSTPNSMILLTSNTADPTGTWRQISWMPSGPSNLFLDHPYLGYDNRWIVLSGRRFAPGFQGPSLFLIDKTAMLTGGAITWGVNAQQIDKTSADGDSPCPVTLYEPPFSNVGNPQPNTLYVLQSWSGTSIRLTTVTGNIPTATWNSASAVFPSDPANPWFAGGMNNFAEQMPPETRRLDANDARISAAVMMNGKIWCSHHIGLPASGRDRVAVQWWVLDGNAGTFGNIIQKGRVGGANASEYRWFPTIAVNKDEDVLIGYTVSSNTMRVSAGYVTRQSSTPANTTDDELIYKTGVDRYWKDFSSGRARWGDYSHTTLDPSDGSLWTIQEYADLTAGPIPPDNNSRFGVWWAQVAPSVPASGWTFDATAPAVAACPAPSSMAITQGTTAIGGFTNPITLSVSGNPPGTTVSIGSNPIPPGSSTVITLNGTNTLAFGTYTITLTGNATGAPQQSKPLEFTINPGTGPTINTHPTSQTVCAGSPVTFTSSATGATSYQWQLSTNGGGSWSDISGATANSYTIASTNSGMNNNQYRVIARGQCNNTTSNVATLTVNSAPALSTQPQNSTVCAGSNATFSVTATGTALTYQWEVSVGGGPFGPIGGATTSSYTVNNATTGMSGNQYRVVVSGSCTPSVTSSAATLNVVSPSTVSQHPTSTTICEPGTTSASFTATATGSNVIYQWQESTNGGGSWANINNGGVYSGANTATLTLTNIPLSMNGYQYRVLVSNPTCITTAASNAATLVVNEQPAIAGSPSNVTLCGGNSHTFTVTATGTSLTYQWQLSTDGGTNYSDIVGATSSSYTVTNIPTSANGYRYRVVVSGACTPPVTSNAAVATVHTPVTITTQPSATAVCATGSTSISVAASGTGPSYQWQIWNGSSWVNITNDATYSGAATATLTINNITAAMTGTRYRNVVSGTAPCGSVTSNETTLNVTPQPVIQVNGPTSLLPGRIVTLSVPSVPGVTYQWFLNGTALPGATGNSIQANVTQLGNYHVVVTSTAPGGTSCTSSNWNIKDSASTRLFIFPSPNDGRFIVSYFNSGGGSTNRTVTVYDSKGSRVYNAKFAISGPYTLMNIDLRKVQGGVYYVVVRNNSGAELARGRVLIQNK